MSSRHTRNARPDEGSALILVLVLMIVGSLIVLPLMSYAMSVGRANTVLSTKTARTEAVKAGLRMAMAEPTRLYETCGAGGGTVGIPLTATGLAVPVSTKCYFIDSALSLESAQERLGLAAVQKGQSVPPGMLSTGYVSPDPSSTSAWIADSSLNSEQNKVWMPDLPVHALSPRAPGGWQMPAGYPTCTVYFPGTYTNPVTITGPNPTYFASGIYYFEDTVTIQNGASVVVGGGVVEGCATDQYAAFYAVNAPSTHNINGLGATFVFGGAGRLAVANDIGGPINVQFNKRYVAANDPGAAPSADVSIMSVNGKLGLDGITGENLAIPDVLEVPLSHVGQVTAPALPVSATTQKYLPSTLVPPPAPTVPDPPTSPVATGYLNSMQVSWTAPVNNGGSQITGYVVRVASGTPNTGTCTTVSATSCVISGLTPLTDYTFTVEAVNAVGTSVVSTQTVVKQPGLLPPPVIPPGDPLPPLASAHVPLIDFALTTATPVVVDVPGYVSIPQGRLRVSNPGGLHNISLKGGVLAASFDITDTRVPVPIGLENPIVQRTFRIVSETTSGTPHMVSSAIVQVNQGGAWAINSWEVQGA